MFFLDNPNSNSETYILIRLSLDDGRLKRSTGEKIHPSLWNQAKGKVKPSKGNYDISRINQKLISIEEKINKRITELKLSDTPITKSDIQELFDDNKSVKKRQQKVKFLTDAIDEAR